MRFAATVVLACWLSLWGTSPLIAENDTWGDKPANLTTGEYLRLFFTAQFEWYCGRETRAPIVLFYPSPAPETAVLLLSKQWNFHGVAERDQKRILRQWSANAYAFFQLLSTWHEVSSRWGVTNPKNGNFIIKHTREEDTEEVLAVTVSGETFFYQKDIERAASLVQSRGGCWGQHLPEKLQPMPGTAEKAPAPPPSTKS